MEYLGWIVALWLACIVWCLLEEGNKEPNLKANTFAMYLMVPVLTLLQIVLWVVVMAERITNCFRTQGNKPA